MLHKITLFRYPTSRIFFKISTTLSHIDTCSENTLALENTFFQRYEFHEYTKLGSAPVFDELRGAHQCGDFIGLQVLGEQRVQDEKLVVIEILADVHRLGHLFVGVVPRRQ